jgi:hypothetical protein
MTTTGNQTPLVSASLAAPPPTPASAPSRDEIAIAFRLGWHIAELYASNLARQQPAEPSHPPDDLPGLSALSDHERDLLLAAELAADLQLLCLPFARAGLTAASCEPALAALGDLDRPKSFVKTQLYTLHKQLLNQTWSADFRLGKAYGLGRALADTTLIPQAADAASFRKQFNPYRIEELTDWLRELATALPDHSAHAVGHSLQQWTDWTAAHVPQPAQRAAGTAAIDDRNRGEEIDRCLRAQGRIWRALLSGEKRAEDLLKPADYVAAAQAVIDSTARLVVSFGRKWAHIILPALTLFIGLLVVFFVYLNGAAKTATVITTLLAASGLTWKGLEKTLGQVLTRAEQPIWQMELARAAAVATTILPE